MKRLLTSLIFLFFALCSCSQEIQLSDTAEVSILTMGPGVQLYDSFGHSAFRIFDLKNGIDKVYNYGVYDFNTPNFYTKFAQGKLLYKLDNDDTPGFLRRYIYQKRWIKEQVLNLNPSEKQEIFAFLENNAKPENQFYLYDFFYDNCATKIRDVLTKVLGNKLQYHNDYIDKQLTFRELIQKNVNWNSWGSFGMDLAIGAVVDKKASPWEHQFLPEYVYKASEKATIKHHHSSEKLIKKTNLIFEGKKLIYKTSFFTSPFFIMSLLGFFILWITYTDFKKKTRTRYLDTSIFLITGIIGVLLLLLWFATDHSSTKNNYNLLWAFAFNILFFISISKKSPKKWLTKYVFFLVLMLLLLSVHWLTGVQHFAPALLPFLIALFFRYVYVYWYLKRKS
ncbi:MAG: lipoprotein N-acyltransferase Lnb domain-containing protein [Flavobacteriales bacterium]